MDENENQQGKKAAQTIFYSYVDNDRIWRDRLSKHFSQLRREGLIIELYDQRIPPGVDRVEQINQAIRSAEIIILLISSDFLASDAFYQDAMQMALKCHKAGKIRIVPIIVRPCDWMGTSFAHLQYLPRNGRPIVKWKNRDDAFLAIVHELRQMLDE